jgi:lysophospholipase L1-like esterase
MSFNNTEHLPLYGVSFESENGVILDNYSLRSNSGLPLTKIPMALYRALDTYFEYDLIILHYGLNVVGHDVKSYSWYEIGYGNAVRYMKKAFPRASILIVSVGDKSVKDETEWKTEPDVLKVLEAQKNVAKKNGVAFWNFYESMGGYNAMKHWVEGDTVFAARDYTHLNHRGAKRMADSLFAKLMEGYKEYEKTLR